MNKQELVKAFAETMFCPKSKAEWEIDKLFEVIRKAILSGEDYVIFPGIGRLRVVERAARKGYNPRHRREVTIPACKAAKLLLFKNFKEELNKKN